VAPLSRSSVRAAVTALVFSPGDGKPEPGKRRSGIEIPNRQEGVALERGDAPRDYFMVGMTNAESSTSPSGQRAVTVLTLV
jgi:hypothetical protein